MQKHGKALFRFLDVSWPFNTETRKVKPDCLFVCGCLLEVCTMNDGGNQKMGMMGQSR